MTDIKKLSADFAAKKISRRTFMQGALATGLTVAAASSLADKALASTPNRGGHLKIAMGHGSTTDTMDPALTENGKMITCNHSVHGYLTEVAPDGSLRPELAESWEASDDAKTWRFKLREGLTFHNGKDLTAEDVIASYNHHRGEDSKSAAKPLVATIKDITADGSHTVVFDLETGNADFPFFGSDYHLPIMPAVDGKADWQSGIFSGPYVQKEYEPGQKFAGERFANFYRDDVAFVDSFEILSIIDVTARMNALKTGDVHVADRVDLKTAHLLGRVPSVKMMETSGTLHYTFPMRTQTAPFDNNDLRLALKYSIDREELVEKILYGHGVVGNDHPIGRSNRFHATDLEQTSYDPDKARFHIKKAGLENTPIDLRAADAAFAGAVDAAQLFQASAAKGGVNINVIREPNDGYWSNVWNKQPFCACYWGGRPTEDWMYATAYMPGVPWNDTEFDNKRFAEVVEAARSELDEAKRREMYFETQQILNREGGVIVPMFANYVFAVAKDQIGTPETIGAVWDLDSARAVSRWWLTG